MSNSPLASTTVLSPNFTRGRTYKGKAYAIDTITIHCFVGQVTAERGCKAFLPPGKKASCNYVVGYDGSIGLCVEEENRSWCSGGKLSVNGITGSMNDYRAVTIEAACDPTHPYAVTDKAYAALIALCADICKRNGIKRLLWKGDRSLVGKVEQQNMTVHRWFANKACPGDYLYERHGDIAAQVNRRLGEGNENMDQATFKKKQFDEMMEDWLARQAGKPASPWSRMDEAKAAGITDGTRPQSFATREEVATMLVNADRGAR